MGKFKREQAQAADFLEEPVISSVLVAPINTFSFTKQFGTRFVEQGFGLGPLAGAVGGVITGAAEAVAGRNKEEAEPLQLLPQMLLVVSQTQVALFGWNQGFFKNSLGQFLFSVPKQDVIRFDVGLKTESLLRHGLALELAGGIRIEFESHIWLRKYSNAVKSALNK